MQISNLQISDALILKALWGGHTAALQFMIGGKEFGYAKKSMLLIGGKEFGYPKKSMLLTIGDCWKQSS